MTFLSSKSIQCRGFADDFVGLAAEGSIKSVNRRSGRILAMFYSYSWVTQYL